ncbi:MAG: GTP 3',8-cyclase MoaA [Clostridia bacterium]|nr:GTP 3',8-cyclase MoaA [Clostridia bacterium]
MILKMKDNLGREINYLRVSVTQRCNLNCVYCGCENPDRDEMTADEIEKAVRAFAKLGINKVRLTGGEPLVRNDITEIACRLRKTDGIKKLVLTTNGVRLFELAQELKAAGVDAINVSLDSLDRENYKKMTGRDALPDVLRGIDRAIECGIKKIRINSVLIRGFNDMQADNLIYYAKDRNVDVRFIELMPFSDAGNNEKLIVKADEILKRFPFLTPVEGTMAQSVAKYYEAEGFKGKIGFITPVSDKFCSQCNRIRLLSTGKIRPCLGYDTTYDIREYLNDEEKLLSVIEKAISSKPAGHNFECAYGNVHAMNKIGG